MFQLNSKILSPLRCQTPHLLHLCVLYAIKLSKNHALNYFGEGTLAHINGNPRALLRITQNSFVSDTNIVVSQYPSVSVTDLVSQYPILILLYLSIRHQYCCISVSHTGIVVSQYSTPIRLYLSIRHHYCCISVFDTSIIVFFVSDTKLVVSQYRTPI